MLVTSINMHIILFVETFLQTFSCVHEGLKGNNCWNVHHNIMMQTIFLIFIIMSDKSSSRIKLALSQCICCHFKKLLACLLILYVLWISSHIWILVLWFIGIVLVWDFWRLDLFLHRSLCILVWIHVYIILTLHA